MDSRNSQERLFAVVLMRYVRVSDPAALASVNNLITRRSALECHWLHHSPTPRSAIAGIHIHMLAPETSRTVVGVSVPPHAPITVFAYKVFYRSFEIHMRTAAFLVANAPARHNLGAGGKRYYCTVTFTLFWIVAPERDAQLRVRVTTLVFPVNAEDSTLLPWFPTPNCAPP